MSKRYPFCCNHCDKDDIVSKDDLIKHYRKEHQDNAYGLWDILGTTGDAFADNAMEHVEKGHAEIGRRLTDAENKARAYDELVPRFQVLGRALRIVTDAAETAWDAERKVKK